MPKAKLDYQYCLTARCEAGRKKTDFWDTHIAGFVLEARASGGKTYALRFTDAAGRQRQFKIGRFEDITNEQARKKAKQLRAEVVLGGNPSEVKADRKAIPLYAELAELQLDFALGHLRSHANVEMTLRRHILPRWADVRLDEIRTADVAKWLMEKAAEGLAPATVERIRMTFNRSFELGAKMEVPGAQVNPVRNVPRKRFHNARERYLSAEEAARLHEAAAQSENRSSASSSGCCSSPAPGRWNC